MLVHIPSNPDDVISLAVYDFTEPGQRDPLSDPKIRNLAALGPADFMDAIRSVHEQHTRYF